MPSKIPVAVFTSCATGLIAGLNLQSPVMAVVFGVGMYFLLTVMEVRRRK